ncbi:hypothetical protein BN1058_02757 [Paraliobacillus sp. PM-2]|nr:hypothetical protein BN1058_02757 [Paraliobacillus sp. PM-2]
MIIAEKNERFEQLFYYYLRYYLLKKHFKINAWYIFLVKYYRFNEIFD